MVRRPVTCAALLQLVALCGCVSDYGEMPFACLRSSACPQGYECVNGACVREGRAADGSRDRVALADRPRDQGTAHAERSGLDAPSSPDVLLLEDFDGNTSALTGDTWGLWSLQGGTLNQSSCTFDWSAAVATGKSWLDVEVAVQVRPESFCSPAKSRRHVSVLARVNSLAFTDSAYAYCSLDFDGFLEVGRVGPLWAVVGSPTKASIAPPPLGSWVALSLATVGGQLTCKLTGSGAPVSVTHVDPSPLPAATAGVATAGMTARFDNFLVVAK
jgi:hypothetical protein